MANLTQKELNQIIDSSKSHAKKICDDIYNKIAKEIGGCEVFKAIIDRSFDYIADLEITWLKEYFNEYFNLTNFTVISTGEIVKLISTRKHIHVQIYGRGCNKSLTNTTNTIITRAVIQSFVEELLGYLCSKTNGIVNYE